MTGSKGQKLVGASFNPSGSNQVDLAKGVFADMIDAVKSLECHSEEAAMIQDETIRKIMDAQMWTVKALTWKD